MNIGDIVKVKQSGAVGVVISSQTEGRFGPVVRIKLVQTLTQHLFQVKDLEIL